MLIFGGVKTNMTGTNEDDEDVSPIKKITVGDFLVRHIGFLGKFQGENRGCP